MENKRKYEFSWELLGNIEQGRPNMGNMTRVEIYRLMQFTFRHIIEKELGTKKAEQLFYDSGKLAGKEFYSHYLKDIKELNQFINQIQSLFKEMGIGILRLENIDLDNGELILTVSEDLDCSGLPENGIEICTYDEGFISALLENFTGKPFVVKEIDCWCTGDRTCRFQAKRADFLNDDEG